MRFLLRLPGLSCPGLPRRGLRFGLVRCRSGRHLRLLGVGRGPVALIADHARPIAVCRRDEPPDLFLATAHTVKACRLYEPVKSQLSIGSECLRDCGWRRALAWVAAISPSPARSRKACSTVVCDTSHSWQSVTFDCTRRPGEICPEVIWLRGAAASPFLAPEITRLPCVPGHPPGGRGP